MGMQPRKESWADRTLKQLSRREKIAQCCVVATIPGYIDKNTLLQRFRDSGCSYLERVMGKTPYTMEQEYIDMLICTHGIGGVIYLFKATPEQVIASTNRFQKLSKYPLAVVLDAEWGLSMRLDSSKDYPVVRFPRNMTLGAIQDSALLYRFGQIVGGQCKAVGSHINCAPVVDVNNNPKNPVINDRAFSEDREIVAKKATLVAAGLRNGGVIPCAKHFPGHGDTDVDSHLDLPVITHNRSRLNSIELYPFKELARTIEAVMTAHLAIPALEPDVRVPSSLSRAIVTDLLKKELGFKGLVITDGLGMEGVLKHHKPGELERDAFLAGNDILLCPVDTPKAIELIDQAIEQGRMSEQELDERVLKMLRLKEQMGLHKKRFVDPLVAQKVLRDPAALALKKELYEQAITLVQNNASLLPLSQSDFVGCVGIQIGGVDQCVFSDALRVCGISVKQVSSKSSMQELKRIAIDRAHTIILGIFDMNKFAAHNYGLSPDTLAYIKQLKAQGKKIILTLFGNPYSLKNFAQEDAIIMAYEDDPDAQQAAVDVVMGRLKACGKLPITASDRFKIGCGLS